MITVPCTGMLKIGDRQTGSLTDLCQYALSDWRVGDKKQQEKYKCFKRCGWVFVLHLVTNNNF